MRQRDADLRVDVHREARAIEAAGARASPDVRGAEVLHRDPHDAAVLRGSDGCRVRQRRRRRRVGRLRVVERLRLGRLGAGCREPGARLRLERGLTARLRRLHALDLALDR